MTLKIFHIFFKAKSPVVGGEYLVKDFTLEASAAPQPSIIKVT